MDTPPHRNCVTLLGRVAAPSETRELPSGDLVTTFRLVVDRPPARGETRRRVDALDVTCWGARPRRSAAVLGADDLVEVEGSLRRRFFATGGGRASRYEVEAARVRRLRRPASP